MEYITLKGIDKMKGKNFISLILVFAMLASMVFTQVSAFAKDEILVDAISNGSHASSTYDKGVFSALADGSGLFAIALYKDDELVKISFSESEEELKGRRLNMIIDEIDGTSMKIFRFDSDGTPVAVNKTLAPKEKDYTVYFNESFDSKSYQFNLPDLNIIDGRLYRTSGRFGGLPINYPERYIVIEADYALSDASDYGKMYLLSNYVGSPIALVYMWDDGIYAGHPTLNNTQKIYPADEFKSKGKMNVACLIDVEEKKYDVYIDGEKKTKTPVSLQSQQYKNAYDSMSIYPLYFKYTNATDNPCKGIFVDNVKAYSGTDFIDIGNERPTSHKFSYNNAVNSSKIYERPEAEDIAAKVVDSPRPRIAINSKRVEKIKNSTDPKIVAMREAAIEKANDYLDMDTYTYESGDDTFSNMDNAMTLMMNLGMAYLLADDKTDAQKYVQRAYKEAEKLFDAKGKHETNEGGIDYWNSHSFLDVGEACTIMAICYDWMYDGLTKEQRAALEDNTIEKGILRSFRSIYSEYNPTLSGTRNFAQPGNWGAVCNGGVMMACIAFMEADPFMCSQMAEANIRAIETTLASFAPMGAWSEGVGYWNYTLKNLSLMCATLDSTLGSTFGLEKAEGLEESQYFSIASEGKVNAVNYGDKGAGRSNAPFLYYWAKKYDDPEIGGLAEYIKDNYNFDYSIYDLIYYDSDYIHKDDYDKPHFFYFSGDSVEQITMESGPASDGTFIAMTGGKGTASNHDHLDSGSIILDIGGKRLICDGGAGNYNSPLYFSSSRYYYYKARPEGHNVFVINPQILSDASGEFYHGQSKTGVSQIGTNYDADKKWAKMDLSEAYERDAKKAYRTIRLDGDKAIIEDEIVLSSGENLIEWYYHYKDVLHYQYTDSNGNLKNKYLPASYGSDTGAPYCEVTSDGNSVVYITLRDYTQDGSKITMGNILRKYKITFESDTKTPFKLEIRDAVRNLYDREIINNMRVTPQKDSSGNILKDDKGNILYIFGSDYRGYDDSDEAAAGGTFPLEKIVAVMNGVSGTVKLRTTVEYLGAETVNP